jgi:hypothetical protein
MLDDETIDRLGDLLRGLDTSTLHSRVTLADDAHRLLASAGLSWWEVVVALKTGVEALFASARSNPPRLQTLAWAYGPDWEAMPSSPGGPRAFRYTHPRWGTVAAVRECRDACPCFPREGHPTRWHAFWDVPEEPPLTYPGVSCWDSRLAAQYNVFAIVDAWREEDMPCPEDDPEYQAYRESVDLP